MMTAVDRVSRARAGRQAAPQYVKKSSTTAGSGRKRPVDDDDIRRRAFVANASNWDRLPAGNRS